MFIYFLLITTCCASNTGRQQYRNNQGWDIDWYFSKPPIKEPDNLDELNAMKDTTCSLGHYKRENECVEVPKGTYSNGFDNVQRCPRNTYGGHGGIWSCKPCPYGGNDIAVNTIEECSIRNYNADSTFYERVNNLVEPNGHLYPGDDCYYNTDETLLERIGKLSVEAFEELDDGPCESYPMEIKERFMDVLERTGLKAIIAFMGGPFTIQNLISLILHIAMYCLTNLDAMCVPYGFLDFFYRTFGKVVESIADRDLFLREMETTGKVIEEKLFHGYIDPAICLSLNSRRRLMKLKQIYKLRSSDGCSTTCEQKGTLVPTEGICSQPNIGQVCSGAIVSQHYDIETGGYFDADDCGFYNGICLLNIEDYSDPEKPYLGRRNTGFRGTCACPKDKIHLPDNPNEPCIDKCQGEQIGVYYMNINGNRDYTCINKCQTDYSLKLPYSCNIDMLSRPHMLCNTEEVENIDCCAAFNEPIYYRNGDKVEFECRDILESYEYYKTPDNCKLDRNSKLESLCTIEELQNIEVKDSCDPNPCSHNRRCEPGIFYDKFHNKHTYRCHCSEYENGNFISSSNYEVDWFDETKPVNWNCALPSIDYCADDKHYRYFTKITIGDKSICTTEAFAFDLAEKNTNCTKTRDNYNIWLKTLHCPENTIIYEKYQDPCNPNPCSDGSKCWNKDVVEDYSTGRGYDCDCTDWDKYSMSADRPGMKVNDENFYFSICQLYKNGCYYSSHPEIFDHTDFYFGRGYPGYTHEEYKEIFGCRYGDCAIYDYNYCVGDGSTNICAEKYGIDLMTFNNIERRGWVRESLTHSPRDGFQCIYRCPPGKGINGHYPNSLNFDRGITEFFEYTYDESIHYGEIIRDTSNICKECIQGYYSKSELNVDLCVECSPGSWQYENGKDYCNSPCNPNPCQNNGTCTWEWNNATNDYVKHSDHYGNQHDFVCECTKWYKRYDTSEDTHPNVDDYFKCETKNKVCTVYQNSDSSESTSCHGDYNAQLSAGNQSIYKGGSIFQCDDNDKDKYTCICNDHSDCLYDTQYCSNNQCMYPEQCSNNEVVFNHTVRERNNFRCTSGTYEKALHLNEMECFYYQIYTVQQPYYVYVKDDNLFHVMADHGCMYSNFYQGTNSGLNQYGNEPVYSYNKHYPTSEGSDGKLKHFFDGFFNKAVCKIAMECRECPGGTKKNGDTCVCDDGSDFSMSSWQAGTQYCIPCQVNQYRSGNECIDCPGGLTAIVGSTECTCPEGTNRIGNDCECAGGSRYSKALWQLEMQYCIPCPVKHYRSGTECIDCPAGKTAPANSTECEDMVTCTDTQISPKFIAYTQNSGSCTSWMDQHDCQQHALDVGKRFILKADQSFLYKCYETEIAVVYNNHADANKNCHYYYSYGMDCVCKDALECKDTVSCDPHQYASEKIQKLQTSGTCEMHISESECEARFNNEKESDSVYLVNDYDSAWTGFGCKYDSWSKSYFYNDNRDEVECTLNLPCVCSIALKCENCPPGQVRSKSDPTQCEKCPPGQYRDAGMTECSSCLSGLPSTDRSECVQKPCDNHVKYYDYVLQKSGTCEIPMSEEECRNNNVEGSHFYVMHSGYSPHGCIDNQRDEQITYYNNNEDSTVPCGDGSYGSYCFCNILVDCIECPPRIYSTG